METNFLNRNYLIANKIRMKLLILIDTEIQNKKNKFLLKDQEQNKLYINFEETYIQEERKNYFTFNEKSKPLLTEINHNTKKLSPTRAFIYSKNNSQSEQIGNKNKKYSSNNIQFLNTAIFYNNKNYLLKRNSKISSAITIYQKQKTDKQFLKNLCDNLKITPKKQKARNISKHFKNNNNYVKYRSTWKIIYLEKENRRNSFGSTSPNKNKDKISIKPNPRKSLFAIRNGEKLRILNNAIIKNESKLS